MKKELAEGLCRDFPILYRKRHDPNSPMTEGFVCRDGWEPMLRDLSEKIEKEILSLPEEKRDQYYAIQVKEKFGTLRFYMSTTTSEMQKLIDEAEQRSCKICEGCSQPGYRRPGGYISVLCEPCYAKRINEMFLRNRKES